MKRFLLRNNTKGHLGKLVDLCHNSYLITRYYFITHYFEKKSEPSYKLEQKRGNDLHTFTNTVYIFINYWSATIIHGVCDGWCFNVHVYAISGVPWSKITLFFNEMNVLYFSSIMFFIYHFVILGDYIILNYIYSVFMIH